MLLTTAEALNTPEGAPSDSNVVGWADGGAAATALSPTSEPSLTASPKESQRKADANCTTKVRCLHCGRPHSADSADCQLWKESGAWPPSRHQLPPTCLIGRLKQLCGQALAGRVVPQLKQPTGKSYPQLWEVHPRW
ncbi:hypothetical protein MTO96_029040 [Rhipicephalus appendiculatus]